MDNEYVSIIIPCRNEEKFIAQCFDSIIANNYPKNKLKILVIDGASTDRTPLIIKEYTKKYAFIHLLDNPRQMQTYATNIGIKAADSDILIRMDAHVKYHQDFITKAVHWLKKSNADCVGGICITRPGANTRIAASIALALSHPFGVGNSLFRIGLNKPQYVDTVPFGCYGKEVFEKIGLFNENLNRTDDLEFNLRLKRTGGKLLLVPDIVSYYYARPNLYELGKQNFGNGFWVIYSLKFVKLPFSGRHLIPFGFVSALILSLGLSLFINKFIYLFLLISFLYGSVNLFFTIKLCLKNGFKYFGGISLAFLSLHISYGLGSIMGLIKLTSTYK